MRALVLGLGAAGESAARALLRHGYDVAIADDAPSDVTMERAARLGLRLGEPTLDVDVVVPGPSVPITHPVVVAALERGVKVWSEFELAAQWSDTPMVAITGTDGKTTVTTLVERMLAASGLRTVAAGNMDPPLVDVLDRDLDVIVVEASSFRLEFTETFRPRVGLWLNLAPDHLDVHPSMDHYARAKAKIWAHQRPDDVAVANAEDGTVMRFAREAPGRLVTFGYGTGDWRVDGEALVMPDGDVLMRTDDLFRALPHDCTNALAAAASALHAGGTLDGVRDALRSFRGLPHRVALVGHHDGVAWYDDSKATGPNAALAAIRAFSSVVLIAGGRSKVDDLGALADDVDRIRAVVAIGEAAPLVIAAFDGKRPVEAASSMDEAVARAAALAQPGDVVLLSPACASWDWYDGYAARGDDFARAAREVVGVTV